jgi:hypothetical protein
MLAGVQLQIGNLIDMLVHGSGRTLGIPAPKRRNHRLVSLDRS